jgi:mono/diheme cytochrome c family protein
MNVNRQRPRAVEWLIATVVAAGLLAALPAQAFEAETGHQLARMWCASCHLVEPDGGTSDVTPGFQAIADDPARTPERLRAWLNDPHPPMPKLSLTRQEIDAILAYLDSLRKK